MADAIDIVPYVRDISSLSSTDIDDNQLRNLAVFAWQDLMSRVQKEERFEKIDYIDQWRQNRIDGSNATFYTLNSFRRYLGDWNIDMSTLTSADAEVWSLKNDNTYAKLTVSAVNEDGYVTLSAAPAAGSKLYFNYAHLPVKFSTSTGVALDARLRNALAYLVTSLAYGKLDPGDYEKVGFRGIVLQKSRRGSPNLHLGQAFDSWMGRYINAVEEINATQCIMRRDDLERAYALQVRSTYLTPPQ